MARQDAPDIAPMPVKHASACLAYAVQSALFSIAEGAALPEWVHLVPAGELRMVQERNVKPLPPGVVPKLCSFDGLETVDRAPIDVNHANAKRGTQGEHTPAYGWLMALDARADGVWGRVEWNANGEKAIRGREYRALSAELMTRNGEIIGIRGASLTNHPNLKGLTPVFNSTEDDDPMEKILKDLLAKLGLKEDATPDAVLQSVTTLVASSTALTTQLAAICKAAGAAADAKPEVVLQAVTDLAAKKADVTGDDKVIKDLQADLQSVTSQLNTLKDNVAREKAEAFVDGAIKAGRVGVKPMRDHYIKRHMMSAADVEKEIGAMPVLQGERVLPEPPKDGALSVDEQAVAKMMGVSVEAMTKSKAALAAADQEG